MSMVQSKKSRILVALICIVMMSAVFIGSAVPVAASDVFSKKVSKSAGTWSGSARHASTAIKVTYGCKKKLVSYQDYCKDSVSAGIGQNHRARIKNSKGTAYGKKVEYGFVSSVTKTHVGTTTYFQSEYHMK